MSATDQGSAVGHSQRSAARPRFVECPRCDPLNPELDEQGRPFACYCCGDTGLVAAEAEEDSNATP